MQNIIVVDIETTGTKLNKHGVLSIGATDYASNTGFYQECRVGFFTKIDDEALKVNGFTKKECRDKFRPTQHVAYTKFYNFCTSLYPNSTIVLAGQQVGSFDIPFLQKLHLEIGADIGPWIFGYRSIDLHSVAFAVYGQSLGLDAILQRLDIERPPGHHNALIDSELEKMALKRITSKIIAI